MFMITFYYFADFNKKWKNPLPWIIENLLQVYNEKMNKRNKFSFLLENLHVVIPWVPEYFPYYFVCAYL